MRGETERQATMMLGVTPDGFVPKHHLLRRIKPLADSVLGRMSSLFAKHSTASGAMSRPLTRPTSANRGVRKKRSNWPPRQAETFE